MNPAVTIYCDGSGVAGGHPCGFAAVVIRGKEQSEIVGSLAIGTNNVAEIMAAVIGLESLVEHSSVTVVSDSAYVVNTMAIGWWKKWESNGWRRFDAHKNVWNPVPNAEYWQRLIAVCERHDVTFKHVKGHSGNPFNDRCDKLAGKARKNHGVNPVAPMYDADGNRMLTI